MGGPIWFIRKKIFKPVVNTADKFINYVKDHDHTVWGKIVGVVLDEGITQILKKLGMEEKLYDGKNYEMGLGQKIRMLTDYSQPFGRLKEE